MNTMSTQKTPAKRPYRLRARAESQERTRQRIAAAAAELHEEVGVTATTVADIARRAGVQRLTVYNHFPTLAELLPACSAHYATIHPLPDPTAIDAVADPLERVRAALRAFYGWYRATERLQRHVNGDRTSIAELDAFLVETDDALRRTVVDRLVAGFDGPDGDMARRRALLAVALEFWTWQRLQAEGLDDAVAADLMTDSLCAVAPDRGRAPLDTH